MFTFKNILPKSNFPLPASILLTLSALKTLIISRRAIASR